MAICLCGCGEEAGTRACAKPNCYTRYRRNGFQAVPKRQKAAPKAPHLIPCPTCPRKMRPGHERCGACRGGSRIVVDLRPLIGLLTPCDPYPLETTSVDRALVSPVREEAEVRLTARGLLRVPCPCCGGRAVQEPPCTVNGVEQVVVRCPACEAGQPCQLCGLRPRLLRRNGRRPKLCAECVRARKVL